MQSRPKEYTSEVKDTKWISSKALEVTLKPTNPAELEFVPGQYINVEVSEGKFRSYSISSDPAVRSELKIIAGVLHEGAGSNYLKGLNKADVVKFIGPSGKFIFQKSPAADNIIFVATGTGVSPFITMLYSLQRSQSTANIHLYFGIRHEKEMLYKDLLDNFKKNLNFDYTICTSQPQKRLDAYEKGRVTEYFKLNDLDNTHVYLCGHPEMVEDMIIKLDDLGISKENVFYEKYTHSKK